MRDLLRRCKGSYASRCALGFRILLTCIAAIPVVACGGGGGSTTSDTTGGVTLASTSSVTAGTVVIVDNATAGFSTAGSWSSSTGIAGYYGSDYQYASRGDGSRKAKWAFAIATSGTYSVDARWTAYGNRAVDAPYTVYNNGIVVGKVTKNQQIGGGQFNPLGSYNLTAGTLVVVLDNNASGYVIADAVRLTGSGTTSGGTTSSSTTTSTSTSTSSTTTSSTGSGTTSGGTTSSSTTTSGTTTSGTSATAQTGSITLKWTPPVTRADGTPLSLADIDGYRVHYGKSAGNYTNHLNVPDGTAQSVTVTGVSLGVTYYIVMSTYDVDGRESGYSKVISKSGQ